MRKQHDSVHPETKCSYRILRLNSDADEYSCLWPQSEGFETSDGNMSVRDKKLHFY